MSIKLVSSIVPSMETCPNCKGEMTVTQVTPILFADHLENITYRCKACRSEMKRTFDRRSGIWQLIRSNPDLQANCTENMP
jgi:type II secretory ATPase GspE/PulE/Tfp pilus assembly ATPase PilB-like protein